LRLQELAHCFSFGTIQHAVFIFVELFEDRALASAKRTAGRPKAGTSWTAGSSWATRHVLRLRGKPEGLARHFGPLLLLFRRENCM
jgi:hypothetical protein